MIQLLLTVFAGGGAVGFGAILKGIFGGIQSICAWKTKKVELEGLRNIENAEVALKFLSSQFGSDPGGMFSRHTRRMLALIGVISLAGYGYHCFLFQADPFITLPSVAAGDNYQPEWSFAWGLITIPRSNEPIYLTLGHVGLSIVIAFEIILGFYFTPGGTKN